MIQKLIKLANDLDKAGFTKEADYLDNIINKMAKRTPGGAATRPFRGSVPVSPSGRDLKESASLLSNWDWASGAGFSDRLTSSANQLKSLIGKLKQDPAGYAAVFLKQGEDAIKLFEEFIAYAAGSTTQTPRGPRVNQSLIDSEYLREYNFLKNLFDIVVDNIMNGDPAGQHGQERWLRDFVSLLLPAHDSFEKAIEPDREWFRERLSKGADPAYMGDGGP
ncbi:MAG: hypothetical protein CBE07_001590 [Pelagibacteraceae bacterium TMED247]|nr:MAG: hypothetical protein CBE07_001590 [Pelagibacteraceae bacterium TMED247]